MGRLSELADLESGEVTCVFICCDLPYQYIDGYFDKLKEDHFPPIVNKVHSRPSVPARTEGLIVDDRFCLVATKTNTTRAGYLHHHKWGKCSPAIASRSAGYGHAIASPARPGCHVVKIGHQQAGS